MLTSSKNLNTPQKSSLPKSKTYLIKDWNFYKSNESLWNNKYRTSDQVYKLYHKQMDDQQYKIDRLKKIEEDHKKQNEQQKKEKINLNVMKSKTRLIENKGISHALQSKSGQNFFSSDSQLKSLLENDTNTELSEVLPKRIATAKSRINIESKWNNLAEASKKNIDLELKTSIPGEEYAIQVIHDRIINDRLNEEERKMAMNQKHKEIRALFLSHHHKNLDLEKRSSQHPDQPKTNLPSVEATVSPKNSKTVSIMRCNTAVTNFTKDWNIDSPLPKYELRFSNLSSPKNTLIDRNQLQLAERLAVAKQEYEPKNEFDRIEFFGMVVKKADINSLYPGHILYDKLVGNSRSFSQVLMDEKLRKQTIGSRSSQRNINGEIKTISRASSATALKDNIIKRMKINQKKREKDKRLNVNYKDYDQERLDNDDALLHDKNVLNEEIKQFEQVFCQGNKKNGYPKIAFEEAKKLLANDAFAASKNQPILSLSISYQAGQLQFKDGYLIKDLLLTLIF